MNSQNESDMIITSRLSNTKSIVGAIETFVICIIAFYFLNSYLGGNKYVEFVKAGHPISYPDITYEDAFNSFFDSPKWSIDSSLGDNTVLFSGLANDNGKQALYEYRFNTDIENGTFSISSVKIDGIEQNMFRQISLIDSPFSTYKKR